MKYFASAFLMFLLLFTKPVSASDIVNKYMQACANFQKGSAFCDCALTHYSDSMRQQDAQSLPKEKEEEASSRTKLLEHDPALTEERMDAICAVTEEIIEERKKASLARQSGDQNAGAKHDEAVRGLFDKQEQLTREYNLKPGMYKSLSHNYCLLRFNVRNKQRYQENQSGLYGGVEDNLRADMFKHLGAITLRGQSHCAK